MRVSRVEMWWSVPPAAAILLLSTWLTSTDALTTFGKTETQATKVTPTVSPARPCSRQAECAGISGSSCVRTHDDAITRCRCGENQPPVNGQCDTTAHKALYHMCADADQCADGLTCGTPNITGTAPLHLRVHAPTDKICLCDPDAGLVEKDYSCSDADILKTSLFAIFVVTCIRKVLSY